jgi:predicted nuclease of predicted toxin-antitoxin system
MTSGSQSSAEQFAGKPRIDFHSAQSARLDDVPDPEVLALAAREGRILISHDFQTMPRHFRHFTQHQRSPGVLLIRQDMSVGDAIDSLLLIWEASEPDEWADRLCLVPSLVTIAVGHPR